MKKVLLPFVAPFHILKMVRKKFLEKKLIKNNVSDAVVCKSSLSHLKFLTFVY